MDGAILPIAVGVNPTLTISILAERCMRLLAEREGWHIDYDTFKPLGKLVHNERMLFFSIRSLSSRLLFLYSYQTSVHC